MSDTNIITVTIRCATYNHEPYIRQCLEGFVMQQTDFKFEAIVHDDASTDGTANIIREFANKYPDIIKPIYQKENQYSKDKRVIAKLFDYNTHGKYIAICEGDDYWIDPLKLQKQVDILNCNDNVSFVHTNFNIIKRDICSLLSAYQVDFILETNKQQYKIDRFILDGNRYRIQTNTVLFRTDIFHKVTDLDIFKNNTFLMSDTQLWLLMHRYGYIYYLNDITSVYREHIGSACRPVMIEKQIEFDLSCSKMRCLYSKYLNLDDTCIKYHQDQYKDIYKKALAFNLVSNDRVSTSFICNKAVSLKYLLTRTQLKFNRHLRFLIDEFIYKLRCKIILAPIKPEHKKC